MKKLLLTTFCTIILAAAICIILKPVFNMIEGSPHPLVTDVTCIESDNPDDFYWKINQVSVSLVEAGKSLSIRFANNVPNFESYYVKIPADKKWHKLSKNILRLPLPKDRADFYVMAKNRLGGQTAEFHYSVTVRNGFVKIRPSVKNLSLKDIPFRFEKDNATGMNFLAKQFASNLQESEWEKYAAIRARVHSLNQTGRSGNDSNWHAVDILTGHKKNKPRMLCDEYAAVFVSACVSAGLNARMVNLRSKDGRGHYASEIWSDKHQKWIYMDPLYDFSCCTETSCYSALDLHNLYIQNLESNNKNMDTACSLDKNYFSLFNDIQILMSNDFLASPQNSIWDIITFRIQTLRWIDKNTPPISRGKAAVKIFLYYYLPKIGKMLPGPYVGIPVLFVMLLLICFYRKAGRKQ